MGGKQGRVRMCAPEADKPCCSLAPDKQLMMDASGTVVMNHGSFMYGPSRILPPNVHASMHSNLTETTLILSLPLSMPESAKPERRYDGVM